jgi:response regulator RpfG family c-di-GMP phosphodiesterase
MKKPSIRTITVRSLINVLLVIAITVLAITAYNFRALSIMAIENQALAHAELVKAGLTAHMKGGIMDMRDYYLEEIEHLNHVKKLKIIRGENVSEQFGMGNPMWEKTDLDAESGQAIHTSKPVFILNELSLTPSVRVIIPYVASNEGALNCLACHMVAEGAVLGAVDMELDVSEYRNHAVIVIAGLFAISFLALLLVLVNTSRTIRAYVQLPLEMLLVSAIQAYRSRRPVPVDNFRTREFSSVAKEFNVFNEQIIAHQEELHEMNKQLLALNKEIESTLRETVYTMGVIEEQRSKETANHTKRVSLYSRLLAEKMGMPQEQVDLLCAASPLHDIGKLGIPDAILFKPAMLDEDERKIMENHPVIGYEMLKHSQRDILMAAGTIAYQHHEKWDGSGYPRGLKGNEINIFGRIIAMADVFDALYSPRVYKEAWQLDKVVAWISEQRGLHFDPAIVDIFLGHVDEFVEIYNRYPVDAESNHHP